MIIKVADKIIISMSDENLFQNLFDSDNNVSVTSSKSDEDDTEISAKECTGIKPYSFEPCVSDYQSSENEDNVDMPSQITEDISQKM